ncbi:hypothetical protein NFI96_024944 [Prochilodus magdalenae]|nr:hypothetical protein NFI96_024944 [Prochilodus magdalenae]
MRECADREQKEEEQGRGEDSALSQTYPPLSLLPGDVLLSACLDLTAGESYLAALFTVSPIPDKRFRNHIHIQCRSPTRIPHGPVQRSLASMEKTHPSVSPPHQTQCLSWAREVANWTLEDWQHLAMWSGELRYPLFGAGGGVRMRRRPHKAMDPSCPQVTVQTGGYSILPFMDFMYPPNDGYSSRIMHHAIGPKWSGIGLRRILALISLAQRQTSESQQYQGLEGFLTLGLDPNCVQSSPTPPHIHVERHSYSHELTTGVCVRVCARVCGV